MTSPNTLLGWAACLLLLAGCGGKEEGEDSARGGRGGGRGGGMAAMMGGAGEGGEQTAVPVEVSVAERRAISSYIETNGTLEAENEVDVVARTAGPIVTLDAEEAMTVRDGALLARIDPSEIESEREIARVSLEETRLAFERAQRLKADELVSVEAYEDAKAAFESAQAQFEGSEIQLGYTEIRAPFDGLIIERYVKFAQHVTVGQQLFRISDFDPLLCPIQVPERNIPQLRTDQRAYLEVEAWPEERFEARVLRLSPVVDSATGTVRVTLQVEARGKLRPGMFASVYLQTDTHPDAIVIPKAALALESIGDTVYVAGEGAAERREVELGFREGDSIEVLAGLAEGERIITVGQDGLADGTPIQVLDAAVTPDARMAGLGQDGPPAGSRGGPGGDRAAAPVGRDGGGEQASRGQFGGRQRPDIASMTPEQLERMKERMRSFGMTDEQIDARIERLREEQGGQKPAAGSDDN